MGCFGDRPCHVYSVFFCFKNVEAFGLKKVVKQCKQSLMSSLRKSLEDSNTESYVDCGGPDQEVSEGNIIAPELEIILMLFWERMWLV